MLLTLAISLLGGALNGALIARLNVSPLIVTLGSYSLLRGLAESFDHCRVDPNRDHGARTGGTQPGSADAPHGRQLRV